MVFLRMGARLLFLRTDKVEELKDFIVKNLNGKVIEFEQSLDESTEDSTLVFITGKEHEKTDVDDAKYIMLINEPSSIFLASILTSHLSGLIDRADLGPAFLVMRIAGDQNKIIDRLQKSYDGEIISLKEGIRKGEIRDTLVALTEKPIGSRVGGYDFNQDMLLLPHPVNYVQKRLRTEGIVFITQSMESGQWYELRINIYDSKGNYSEHYKRLMLVLNELEVGMILGETWTRDHALILYSVLAYQVRLFTLYPPEEIKKLLVGLEYSEEGQRLVDFDLYYRNKKISWMDVEKKQKKISKAEEGKKYRKALIEKLPEDVANKLLQFEADINSK